MEKVSITKVSTKQQMDVFAQFGNKLYEDCPYAVPDLVYDIKDTFNPKKNPAYDFSDSQLFLAMRGDEVVGRVAAMINRKANETWNVRNVRFGYLDFIDDSSVLKALLDAVEKWGAEQGMTSIQGPMGFTDFDKEGMLVEGFDQMGSMTTYYNYPYYPKRMEELGYVKEADWVQIRVRVPGECPEKYSRVAEMVKRRYKLKVGKLTGNLVFKQKYGQKIFNLLNEAYAPLFGYSALSQRQIDLYVDTYFKLVDLNLVTYIEDEAGELISIGVTMGSLSEALRKAKGKLFPMGWYHLLRSLKVKPEKTVEMLLIAVKPEYQGRGINALLFTDLIPIYNRYGFEWAETGPQLETNMKELSQWEPLNPTFPKRRRCYTKSIM